MEKIEELFAERIGGRAFGRSTELYKFEKIKQAKRAARQMHPELELIDLGVGEPDEMADLTIIEELNRQARCWENRGYADNGIEEFQEAAVSYMQEVYGVQGLNPQTEVLHCIGSKSALSMIPQAFINPGDVTLMTVPGYPILGTKTEWLGGEVYPLPLCEECGYLPQLDEIPVDILRRAKLLYINYPNNPTGSVATRAFFESVVQFARKNHILVVQDAAYAALTFGGNEPLSFLSIPGAKEVGIEVHSLSKAFQMTGWRLGFVAGNEMAIKALAAVKDNNDAGQFRAIQKAGAYALMHPELTEKSCARYERRHQGLSKVLQEVGFQGKTPKATFYEYVKIPKGTKDGQIFHSAEEFSEYLIQHAMISTVPWDEAGHYIRLSVTFVAKDEAAEEQVLQEVKRRLSDCKLVFD